MNRYPAVVKSVDRPRREVRVDIPGFTDGSDQFPIAEIEYPIGDRSEQTELRILEGDRIWVAFINGDPRYPIITGFRAKHIGNEPDTRRWVHDNIEHVADHEFRVIAADKAIITVGDTTYVLEPGKAVLSSAEIEFHGHSKFFGDVDCTQTIRADVDVISADVSLVHHLTGGVDSGTGTSGEPIPG